VLPRRPKSREETPKEGTAMTSVIAQIEYICAPHKMQAHVNYFFGNFPDRCGCNKFEL